MEIIINRMCEEDLLSYLDLSTSLYGVRNISAVSSAEVKGSWSELVNSDTIEIYKGIYNSMIIGSFSLIKYRNFLKGARLIIYVENVVVKKKYRGKGIGSQFMNFVINRSKELNGYKILLFSQFKNEETKKFYSNIGFQDDAKRCFEMKI